MRWPSRIHRMYMNKSLNTMTLEYSDVCLSAPSGLRLNRDSRLFHQIALDCQKHLTGVATKLDILTKLPEEIWLKPMCYHTFPLFSKPACHCMLHSLISDVGYSFTVNEVGFLSRRSLHRVPKSLQTIVSFVHLHLNKFVNCSILEIFGFHSPGA